MNTVNRTVLLVSPKQPYIDWANSLEEGTLVVLAGGPKEKIESIEPMLLKMGKKVIYCGAAGSGSSMKIVINLLLCTMTSGLAESLTLG